MPSLLKFWWFNLMCTFSFPFIRRSNWRTTWSWARTLRCSPSSPTTAWRPGPAPSCSSPRPSATTGNWETAVDSLPKKWRWRLEKVSRPTRIYVEAACLTRTGFFHSRQAAVPQSGVRTVWTKNHLWQVDPAVGHHHRQEHDGFP